MSSERRNAFRSSLAIEPLWRRVALGAVALLTYLVAFVPLYVQQGTGTSALSIFPVVVIAWLFGAWGGILAGLLIIPLNALFLGLVGEPGWAIVALGGGREGSALVIVVGAVIGLLRDLGLRLDRQLTDWRKAERALRATEDRYRRLFERSRDPMYVSNEEGRFLEANDSLLRLFGLTRTELEQVDITEFYEDPADREHFRREVARAGFVEDFPVRLVTGAGQTLDCLLTASVRRDGPAGVIEYQGSIRDVSANRTLHELAERRTLELRQAMGELEAFTYSVSHDLRTHLVTIGGFASILWTEYREGFDERAQGFLERLVHASGRMDAFVQDLLDYSRVGRVGVQLERVDLREVVEGAVAALHVAIEERGTELTVRGHLGAVQADRTLLERVVENLVANAVKFVDADRTPVVHIEADQEERRIRLKIRDNGIGMAPQDMERAFRPFERLEPGRFAGTGVGLSIVRKAVERMHGDVGVRANPEGGSTFWVLLPAALPSELEE